MDEKRNGSFYDAQQTRRVAAPLVITHGVMADGVEVFVADGAVRIEDGRIAWVGPASEVDRHGAQVIDVGGRLLLPGFLNAHHHLYSSFAPGISPLGDTGDFVHILDSLWWSLDLALDAEAIYYSALTGLIDSVKHGVTMIFDHHASMGYVHGSLRLIADAFAVAGIKGLLCFETSDRMGADEVQAHIEENLEFAASCPQGSLTRGLFGLHANLTLSDETLRRVAEARPPDLPIHVHCGEDQADLEHCRALGYEGPVDRLHRFGLLASDSILAHAIHLSERDYHLIHEVNPLVVSNPESNANNRVGRMDRSRIGRYLLGTDGMSPDMLATLRSHFLLGDGLPFDELGRVFFSDRYRAQQRFFPETGGLSVGMRADLTALDYTPIAPISLDNVLGHLLFGARGGQAYLTIAEGQVLYHAGQVTFVDEAEVVREARAVARSLHERYYRGGAFTAHRTKGAGDYV